MMFPRHVLRTSLEEKVIKFKADLNTIFNSNNNCLLGPWCFTTYKIFAKITIWLWNVSFRLWAIFFSRCRWPLMLGLCSKCSQLQRQLRNLVKWNEVEFRVFFCGWRFLQGESVLSRSYKSSWNVTSLTCLATTIKKIQHLQIRHTLQKYLLKVQTISYLVFAAGGLLIIQETTIFCYLYHMRCCGLERINVCELD